MYSDEQDIFQPAIQALREVSDMDETTKAEIARLFDLAIQTIGDADENEARSLFLFSFIYLRLSDVEKRGRTKLIGKIGLHQNGGKTLQITFRNATAIVTRSGTTVKLKAGKVERKISESVEDVEVAVSQIMEHLTGLVATPQ